MNFLLVLGWLWNKLTGWFTRPWAGYDAEQVRGAEEYLNERWL